MTGASGRTRVEDVTPSDRPSDRRARMEFVIHELRRRADDQRRAKGRTPLDLRHEIAALEEELRGLDDGDGDVRPARPS